MREVRTGVWHWEARHPEWNERQWWGPTEEGGRLPIGVEAFAGMEPNDLMLWVESHGALVAGDTLQDRGNSLQFLGDLANNVPAERGVGAEEILAAMQPLHALPVEIVLPTHGAPVDRAALERAFATSPG